jgi:hydrophobe/amphiphile efflux-1 (HAE1) family protein
MIAKFFIDHPVFASVISLIITFAGLVSIKNLPIEQYPNITPPMIQVSATYNGANASVMAADVASPLEQQILGAQDMIYMYSQNSATGTMTLDVYFSIGSNADIDQVNVQNLINQAISQLPEEVQKEGITITKQAPNILMIVALQSPSGIYDETYISNYANINVVNELDLLHGISTISVIGQRNYAMRIWLRPDLMAQMGISPQDVIDAVKSQNSDFGIGQLGQAPNAYPVKMTVPLSTQGRLTTPEEFGNIILRADLNGNFVLLKDIAEVTLGAQDYTVNGELNGKEAILLAIYQEYGANALDVSELVRKNMERMAKNFPTGLSYSIPYDSTKFIKMSIEEVVMTIFQAACLVVLVVFVFLQKLRATLIPVMALVVSIIGTFAGMYALGYSINTLTLFGMVLAVGIVVDDAIVVVENIERNMKEFKLDAKSAAIKAMEEVTGPVIAIVCVLCAVFIPVAFLGGIAGQLYKQFAITISISVVFSGLVALTLSPAISAIILKVDPKEFGWAKKFNEALNKGTTAYLKCAEFFLHHRKISLSIYGALLAVLLFLANFIPKSFVPMEDQGYIIAIAYLPDGASLDRTVNVDKMIEQIAINHPGVEHVVSLTGFSLIESIDRTTIGTNFIVFKDWSERKSKSLSARQILMDLNAEFFMKIQDAQILVVNPPAIQGLGTVGGFEFWIENRGDGGDDALKEMVAKFIQTAKDSKVLTPLHTTAQFDNLQFFVNVDRYKSTALGVSINDVFQALQTLVGSVYINNFNKFGRVYQVIVQADPRFRERLDNLGDMYVRSALGQMVPLKSVLSIEYAKGPNLVSRFNDFPAAEILGGANPGYTTDQAIQEMEKIAKEVMNPDFSYGWSGQAYQEIATGGTSNMVLFAALVLVFLILAALYEMWMVPLAIIMAVPFGALGAFIAIYLKGMSNDVYFQIGLVTLIALSAKNAILIVEFALIKVREGKPIIEAALEAARLRFRAILMTSFTFILGVLPLVLSRGAGAASRHSVGVGIFGGMIAATFLALLFVPFFFKLLYRQKNEQ